MNKLITDYIIACRKPSVLPVELHLSAPTTASYTTTAKALHDNPVLFKKRETERERESVGGYRYRQSMLLWIMEGFDESEIVNISGNWVIFRGGLILRMGLYLGGLILRMGLYLGGLILRTGSYSGVGLYNSYMGHPRTTTQCSLSFWLTSSSPWAFSSGML